MIAVDESGFLQDPDTWTEKVAHDLAQQEGVVLTERHWEIIWLARQFYQDFDTSPTMRPFVNYSKQKRGSDKGNSAYLLALFPPSPARIVSKLAGLPEPKSCF